MPSPGRYCEPMVSQKPRPVRLRTPLRRRSGMTASPMACSGIPGYVSRCAVARSPPTPYPMVRDLTPAIVQVDGKNGFAPLALHRGREPLAAKTRRHGLAALAVTHIYHFAALMARGRGAGGAGFGGVCLHRGHELCGPCGGKQATLRDESHGVCLATSQPPATGIRSGVERQCAGRNSVASP